MKFRVSLNVREASLDDGRPLVPGEGIDLTPDEQQNPFNTRLIAEGQLISISQTDKARTEAEERLAAPPPTPNPELIAASGAITNNEGGS